MKLKDLHHNPSNPRKITDEKLEMLKASLNEFGDLSGFVFNVRTQQLISGHQRTKVLPEDALITITPVNPPSKTGTVGTGFVHIDGESFVYREVDWPPEKEVAANIRANNSAGEWDIPRLADMVLEVDAANFPMANLGFSQMELDNLMAPDFSKEETLEKKCPKCGEPI